MGRWRHAWASTCPGSFAKTRVARKDNEAKMMSVYARTMPCTTSKCSAILSAPALRVFRRARSRAPIPISMPISTWRLGVSTDHVTVTRQTPTVKTGLLQDREETVARRVWITAIQVGCLHS